MKMMPLDPEAILRCLDRHGVKYVLIGGLAAVVYGAPLVTQDIDITPALDAENKRRLAQALTELGARLRIEGVDPIELPAIPVAPHAFDQGTTWAWRTDRGDLDINMLPDGTGGYSELEPRSSSTSAFGVRIAVASLDDIIRSKEAAGRQKDALALPILYELRDRLEGH